MDRAQKDNAQKKYEISARDKRGLSILAAILVILLALLAGIVIKVKSDLNTPFTYHFHIEDKEISIGKDADGVANMDGSLSAADSYVYSVDISKHWVNDPGVPLQTYGAQYDNTVTNNSDYDIVNWSVVLTVPERNITIDSYWNGEWEYEKKADTIYFTPDDRIETIHSGDSATFGAVMISKELMDFTDVSFTGCRYKPVTKYFLFWVIMVMLVAWVTSFVAYLLFMAREANHRKNEDRLNSVILDTMQTFANFIDTKDGYTKDHSSRVSHYSELIARKLGMSEEQIRDIGYIGLMHDCGKLAIASEILEKPGRLTPEEFEKMKLHTKKGGDILTEFKAIEGIREGVMYHHERYDGTGYMEGRKGEDIPLVARIIGVADAMDAMNSDRCYRAHLTREKILEEFENNKGTQFDPKIAQIMIDMINSGEVFVN